MKCGNESERREREREIREKGRDKTQSCGKVKKVNEPNEKEKPTERVRRGEGEERKETEHCTGVNKTEKGEIYYNRGSKKGRK